MKKGETLDNRYRIIEKLGEGGMGEVYKAYDQELGKNVAIKLLKPEALSDDKATDQFKKEVRLSQELRHDNITATFDFKRSEEFPYLVMEYVEGQILTNYIYKQPNHQLDEGTFLKLASQILDGVEHAHEKGIIHRDLKSSNIMISDNGQVKIMDFGIAASLRETYSRSTGRPITISIHFASPEQINGEPPSESMDIYSLGCVFYEMLAGDAPFTQGDILHQQLTKKPKPIENISPYLNSVILKCLEKRKEDRFKIIEELKLALVGKDVGVTVKIPEVKKKKPRPDREKRRIPLFLKSAIAVLIIALGILGYMFVDFILKKESEMKEKPQIVLNKSIPVLKGKLNIESNPSEATVFINGNPKGWTPLTLPLEFGAYQLRIEKSDYKEINDQVTINSNKNINKIYNLSLILGILIVKSDPSGASVYLDEVERGNTPLTLAHKPGTYDLRIVKSNFEEVREQVTITADKNIHKNYILQPYQGTLKIIFPGEAEIYVDGKRYNSKNIRLNIGKHTLKINSSDVWGGESIVRNINIERKKIKNIVYNVGELFIACNPYAKIYIDNIFLKETSGISIKKILEGSYKIRIEKLGYPSFEGRFNVIKNITNRLVITFNCTLNKWEIKIIQED